MKRIVLAVAALMLASPTGALAQDAPASPATGTEMTAQDQARAEAGMQALTVALETLRPQADAIRADATLSDPAKRERLIALLDQKETDIRAFETLVGEFTRAQMDQEGSTPEQIELGTEIIRQHLMASIVDNFVAGQPLFGR